MNRTEARKAIRWFQKRVGITGWKITLVFQDAAPGWVLQEGDQITIASAWIKRTAKKATIWISAARAREDGDSLLTNLFHELLHVNESDVGLPTSTEAVDYSWTSLAKICETAYLAENAEEP